MKHTIATTLEQSARLIACGIKPETADMLIYDKAITVQVRGLGKIPDCAKPAWSLSALLSSVLPNHLDNFPFTHWRPPFLEDEIWEKDNPSELNGDVKLYFSGDRWIVDYDWDGFHGTMPQGKLPIEAVVQAIELLHANGYSFNNIE